MEIGTIILGSILIWIVNRDSSNELFSDRDCGYCPQMIHWNKRKGYWVHEDGGQYAPWPRAPHRNHMALPIR